MIHELTNELFLETPKGQALALFLIDRGANSDLEWVCVLLKTGEIWVVKNYEVKVAKNWTMSIRREDA